jgi:hypothetical protein
MRVNLKLISMMYYFIKMIYTKTEYLSKVLYKFKYLIYMIIMSTQLSILVDKMK